MRLLFPLAILLGLVLPGCLAVAGIGAGVVLSQETLNNSTYVVQLHKNVEEVWATVKVSLNAQSPDPVDVDEDLHTAVARINDAKVRVSLEIHDLSRSRMTVSAKQYGIADGQTAHQVYNQLLKELEE